MTLRLDKWLWHARALKTRSLAAVAVSEGRVRVNGARIETPAKLLKSGDVVTVTLPERVLVWKFIAAGERRGPPMEARTLYEDLSPPPVRFERPAASVGEPDGIPAAERRAMDRLLRPK
ncbi:RNA-binding S4 domain-containing protein [Terrarubrum flagellatum]|uniref:RNA-binding S4 domain-containing protein n=1 Tax=Terrirubrum flagellatum TaxID=2895980 RepID=UPI0031456377